MRRHNQMSPEEAKAIAREEQERMEELDEDGICLHCEDAPQNPYLNGKVCLECYEQEAHMGCMSNGCVNPSVGHFRQMELCKVHLADTVHGAYQSYLKKKADLEERKQEFENRVDEVGFDPREDNKAPRDMGDEEKELFDELPSIRAMERELHFLKGDIKKAMNSLDEPFPEGYEVFG